jgi:hypothetical protein
MDVGATTSEDMVDVNHHITTKDNTIKRQVNYMEMSFAKPSAQRRF